MKKNFFDMSKVFIIGEISANHNNSLANAKKLIKLMSHAGFDAVKLQTYKPSTITLNSRSKDFLINKKSPWSKTKTFWDLYNKAHTPWEWHVELFQEAKKNKITIFSSPFDETAVDFLETLKCPIYKIASPEINHLPLIEKISKTKKPIIFSTGLSNLKDIKLAIKVIKKNKCKNYAILKCISADPAPYNELNLKTIIDMKKRFKTTIGFSDHTKDQLAAITSVALGAKIIEKHVTLGSQKTVDSFFSLKAKDFKNFVNKIRDTEKIIGKISYEVSKSSKVHYVGRRSIYVYKDIKKGEAFSKKNIKVVRPNYSLEPVYFSKLLGKKAAKNLKSGSRIIKKYIKNF